MRGWLVGLILLLGSLPATAQLPATSPISGYCDLGGSKAAVSGLLSTNYQQGVIPGCTITVYLHGTTTLATIYADNNNTPLTNPFTAVVSTSPNSGFYILWAANGFTYDVVASGGVAPNTYPSPQTIKEVTLGGSGGGGGATPCGVLYDIQINDPLGTFGCDPGIGQIITSTHTLYENVINGNQQVNVSDTTKSGLICQGHSTGTLVDSAFCTQPSATFSPSPTGGYGLFPPDNSPTTLNQSIRISSLTPTNVTTAYGTIPFYPTTWSVVGGQVSCENIPGLQTCNAPAPATTSDVTYTLLSQFQSQAFMSPVPPSAPDSTVRYFTVNGVNNTASSVVTTIPAIVPGDSFYVFVYGSCGLGGSDTYTISDNAGNTYTSITSSSGGGTAFPYAAWRVNSLVPTSPTDSHITVTVVSVNGACSGTVAHFVEFIGNATVDVFSNNPTGAVPPTWSSLTTTQAHDTIIATTFGDQATSTFAPGSGYGMLTPIYGNYSPSSTSELAAEVTNVTSTGTYTPTMLQPQGNRGPQTFGIAFTVTQPSSPYGLPFFRNIHLSDLTWSGLINQNYFNWTVQGGGFWFIQPTTVASLPACNSTTAYLTQVVTDSNTNTQGATVAGGGSNGIAAFCNGTNWIVWTGNLGTGSVTTTGSPASGNLAKFSGPTTITNGDLSGDATTSGTLVVTVAKVNGVSYAASPSTDTAPVVTAANTATYTSIPNCGSSTQALAYNTSTHTFSCQTVSGTGSSPVFKSIGVNYTVLTTDFSNPSPACGVIKATATLTVTLVINTSQPAAGQCIVIINATVNTNGIITIAPNGQTLYNQQSGSNVTIYGGQSLYVVSDGTNYYSQIQAAAIGGSVLYGNGIKTNANIGTVTLVGYNIGANGTGITGVGNSIFGYQSANAATSATNNNCFGINSCYALRTGSYNVAIGYSEAFNNMQDGSSNVLIGGDNTYQSDTPTTSYSGYVSIAGLLWGDWKKGIVGFKGTTTTIAANACGSTTQGTLTAGSNDTVGEINVGTATVTSCAVSFANTHNTAPFCVLTPEANITIYLSARSTTGFTVASSSNMDSDKIIYHCFAGGNSGNPTP